MSGSSAPLPPMQYTRLGNTGLKVSRICLGCMGYGNPEGSMHNWSLPLEQALPHLQKALELGINFFDTADGYQNGDSERVLGTAIKKFVKDRNDVVIATKCFFGFTKDGTKNASTHPNDPSVINRHGLSRKKLFAAVDESLERLQMDYIDLYQIHRWDYSTPIEETMEALHDLVKSGKIRYIGASAMHAWQFAKAQHFAKERGFTQFISMQNLYNLMYREEEREMIPMCKDMGVGLIPYSPLAGGQLLGKNRKGTTVRTLGPLADYFPTNAGDDAILDRIFELAEKKKATNAQIALAWLFQKGVTPIVGPSKIEQLIDAVKALEVTLTPEEMKYLEEPYQPKMFFGYK